MSPYSKITLSSLAIPHPALVVPASSNGVAVALSYSKIRDTQKLRLSSSGCIRESTQLQMGRKADGKYNDLEGIDWQRVNLCPRTCSHCKCILPTKSEYKIHSPCYRNRYPHLHQVGNKQPYECKYCDKRTRTITTMLEHVRFKHMDDKTYKCNHCHRKLDMKHSLYKHLEQFHYSSNCLVRSCGHRFTSKTELRRHMEKRHPGVEVAKCDNCKRFMQTDAMRKHILTCVAVVPEDGRLQVGVIGV